MIGDFKACGGFLMIATGFRIMKLRQFPTADMIPAMILVMPISWAWVNNEIPSVLNSWRYFICWEIGVKSHFEEKYSIDFCRLGQL